MDLNGLLDHERCHGKAVPHLALETLGVAEVAPGLDSLRPAHVVYQTRVLSHFLCQLLIFFHLLFCVPEPLVNLLLLESERVDKFKDLLSLGRLPSLLFEELPEDFALVPILALPPIFC